MNRFSRKLGKKKQKFRLWRQKFLSGLSTTGLDIEEVNRYKSWKRENLQLQNCKCIKEVTLFKVIFCLFVIRPNIACYLIIQVTGSILEFSFDPIIQMDETTKPTYEGKLEATLKPNWIENHQLTEVGWSMRQSREKFWLFAKNLFSETFNKVWCEVARPGASSIFSHGYDGTSPSTRPCSCLTWTSRRWTARETRAMCISSNCMHPGLFSAGLLTPSTLLNTCPPGLQRNSTLELLFRWLSTGQPSCMFSLQAHPNPSGNWSEWLLSSLYIPNPMAEEVPNKPLDYYTCPFKTSKIDR